MTSEFKERRRSASVLPIAAWCHERHTKHAVASSTEHQDEVKHRARHAVQQRGRERGLNRASRECVCMCVCARARERMGNQTKVSERKRETSKETLHKPRETETKRNADEQKGRRQNRMIEVKTSRAARSAI